MEEANEKKSDCDKQLCHLCEQLNFLINTFGIMTSHLSFNFTQALKFTL